MSSKGASFWCERWHQQIWERLCMHRYKKGLVKCRDCAKGKALLEEEVRKRRADSS